MEADGRARGKAAGERAEAREGVCGTRLVEAADGGGDLRLDVPGGLARRCGEDTLGGARHARAVAARRRSASFLSARLRGAPLGGGRAAAPARSWSRPRGSGTVVTKTASPRAYSGWRRLPAATAYGESGSESAAARHASSAPGEPGPEEGDAEVELHDRALGVEAREPVQLVDRPRRASARTPGRRAPPPSPGGAKLRRARARLPVGEEPRRRAGGRPPRGPRARRARASAAGRRGAVRPQAAAGPVGSLWSETIAHDGGDRSDARGGRSARATRVSGDTTAR